MSKRYQKSEELLKRSEEVIPLGSQTFSKSKTQLPYGISPYFATHAKGAYFWDADGNKYIDFVNGLAAITIGHSYELVNKAVNEQVSKGTIFSLASELEIEVAEKIIKLVPGAEMVRFGKNGSDATTGAIRVARAATSKDHVLTCGYHGWQDWYIGSTTKNIGVPKATQELTHSFTFNDIDSLEALFQKYQGDVACVIMEPMNIEFPKNNFLQKVKELTHANQSLLIFDETITGFRMSIGGAQEYFNVIPDLSTFGKGLANGYPLSVVAGKREYMKWMEEVFFSFTFGGETLSLAAANSVLTEVMNKPIIQTFWDTGGYLTKQFNALVDKHDLGEYFALGGADVWSFILIDGKGKFDNFDMKSLLLQELFKRGIYFIGTHNLSYSHSKEDIDILINAYSEFFSLIKQGGIENCRNHLESEPIKPLFKVR